ncbi:MAG: SDR family NAD(P)-dependent oxidoreductase, partial [Lachnospiraceae bacterium]|nr:SDR family NAD(P)-dependent oxidoreductase [Lachnospiraceae bacterium]
MKKQTVLIAGASRGLGLCFTRKYLEDGWLVLAGVRNSDDVQLKELVSRYPDTCILLPMDVTDTASIEKAA